MASLRTRRDLSELPVPDLPAAAELGVEVTSERRADGSRLVRVSGDLDLATSPTVELVIDVLAMDGEPLALDLSGVTFVDGSGFHMLICSCVLPRVDAEVHVVASSRAIRRMLAYALDVMDDR